MKRVYRGHNNVFCNVIIVLTQLKPGTLKMPDLMDRNSCILIPVCTFCSINWQPKAQKEEVS